MSAGRFSQPKLAYSIALALLHTLRAKDAPPEISPSLLAEIVGPHLPAVPADVIRVFAAKVLALYFEPATAEDIERAGLDSEAAANVCLFLANDCIALANELTDELDRRRTARRSASNLSLVRDPAKRLQ